MKQYDHVYGKINYKRVDDLKSIALPNGYEGWFEAGWIIADGDYTAQWALFPVDKGWPWIPECDLELCHCRRCLDTRGGKEFGLLPLSSCIMVVCPICGNKRCPHAEDHRNKCTGSNELGKIGERDEKTL